MRLPSATSAYLLPLAVAAGVLDAVTYLGLGHVFTANMTGNTVLLGVAVARHSGGDAARAGTALAGFCAGAAGGAALLRSDPRWPFRAAWTFVLETAALVALIVLWAAIGSGSTRYWLIVASAVAMGAQSAAVRFSDARGVNTTYMTSTLLNAIARPILRARKMPEGEPRPSLPGAAWLTYACGALAGAFAQRAWHAGSVAISLALVCAVTAAALCAGSGEPGARGNGAD